MARRGDFPWPKLAFGLCLMAVGIVMTLGYWDVIDEWDYLHYWPLALIVIGLADLAVRHYIGGALWILFGTVLLLPRLGYTIGIGVGDLFALWPLMITAAGIALLTQALRPGAKDFTGARGGTFRAFVMMGGSVQKIGSGDFLGGDVFVLMGGCELDLRDAEIRDEAIIDVTTFWGGTEIRVPETWEVVRRLAPVLGTWEDKTVRPPAGGKRLIIRGAAIMAGVEVSN